jgi:CPA1 family monovalent cation:H+ antiporter
MGAPPRAMRRSAAVKASRLKAIPAFAALDKHELERVAGCAEEIDVQAGEQLLVEGRYAFEFFAIREGAAEVLRDGTHVADLGPGDVFGEIGALSHGQRTASVVTTTRAKVIFIRAQDFRHFAREMPALGERIRRVVEERTRSLGA